MTKKRGTTERGAKRSGLAVLRVFSCAVAVSCAAQRGAAMTADGALITNVVTATYHSVSGTAQTGPNYTMSYLATATVLVSCPVIWVQKLANPTSAVPGGTVTFQVCIVNSSLQASAFNLAVTDQMPDNMAYLNPSYASWAPAGDTVFDSNSATTTTWSNGQPLNGQGAPYYLRWVLDKLAPQKSACVTFMTRVL